MKLVSIIVPCYNDAPYLERCIASLCGQTYSEWEVLLVDDGSTDGSEGIADRMAMADKRIRVFHQSNRGQSAARNLALRHAKGDYIAMVDADDWIEADFLEKCVHALEEGNYDLVQTGYEKEGKRILPKWKWQFGSMCMKVCQRTLIGDTRFETGHYYEDVLFSVDIWLKHPRISMLPYTGYHYTTNHASTTSRKHTSDVRHLLWELCKRGLWHPVVAYQTMKHLAYFMLK